MSTHRKIEWLLFVFSLVGVFFSVWFEAQLIQIAFFGFGTMFAGLHAFKLIDGHKANQAVVSTSLSLVVYTVYFAVLNYGNSVVDYAIYSGLIVSIILSALSLRLRQDFHPS